MRRILPYGVLVAVLLGGLALAWPSPALADTPNQGNGKCLFFDPPPDLCPPCEEPKINCRNIFCKPIQGCLP